jgi:hypothetical protein
MAPFFLTVIPLYMDCATNSTVPPMGTVISQYNAVGAVYEGTAVPLSSWKIRNVRAALSTLQTFMLVISVRNLAVKSVVAVLTVGRVCANNCPAAKP